MAEMEEAAIAACDSRSETFQKNEKPRSRGFHLACHFSLHARSCQRIHAHEIRRILARVASSAIGRLLAFAARVLQSIERQIRKRIRTDEIADLLNALVGGNQLLA